MKFDRIRDALTYVVENLIRRGHKYIIAVRGPKEIHYNRSCCFQVVAETMPYRNCQLGLTIHLPFDQSAGVTPEWLNFLECPIRHHFDKYVWSGIPIFTLRFGKDTDAAERVMMLLLVEVYGYTTGTEFECEVSDEGAIDDEGHADGDESEGDEDSDIEDEDSETEATDSVKPVVPSPARMPHSVPPPLVVEPAEPSAAPDPARDNGSGSS